MFINPVKSVSNSAMITGVERLFGTTFVNFADEFVELGIYSIELFTQRFFHLNDKIRHEFAF